MTMFAKFRLFHASLAILAVLAYLSAEWGAIHAWIGYSLAAVFAARLVAAAFVPGVLGRPAWILRRRDFDSRGGLASPLIGKLLQLAIVACIVGVSVSGIAMQRNWTTTGTPFAVVSQALADDEGEDDGESGEGLYSEFHEASANLLFVFVGLHIVYLVACRRRYALSMAFVNQVVGGKVATKA